MPLPIMLAVAYLAVNLALMISLERERAQGREPAPRVAVASNVLRYGPPLLGVVYLEAIAGDWLFVLFVLAFFAAGFWMLDGLLSTLPPSSSKRMRGEGGHDRDAGARSPIDRDGS